MSVCTSCSGVLTMCLSVCPLHLASLIPSFHSTAVFTACCGTETGNESIYISASASLSVCVPVCMTVCTPSTRLVCSPGEASRQSDSLSLHQAHQKSGTETRAVCQDRGRYTRAELKISLVPTLITLTLTEKVAGLGTRLAQNSSLGYQYG